MYDPKCSLSERKHQVNGLREATDAEALSGLIAVTTEDPSEDLRADAVQSLGRFSTEAIPTLVKVATTDLSGVVSFYAMTTLAQLNTEEAIEALLGVLETLCQSAIPHRDTSVWQALQLINAACALSPALREVTLERAKKLLESDAVEVQYKAAQLIYENSGPEAAPTLAALNSAEDEYLRFLAIEGLGTFGEDAVDGLAMFINDPQPDLRRKVLEVIEQHEIQGAGQLIEQLTGDVDERVARLAQTLSSSIT